MSVTFKSSFFTCLLKKVLKILSFLLILKASLLLRIVCFNSESARTVPVNTATVNYLTKFFTKVTKIISIRKDFCGKYETISLIQVAEKFFKILDCATEPEKILGICFCNNINFYIDFLG